METSIAAIIAGGLGIGIGWGLARRRRPAEIMTHRLVLAPWEDRPRVRKVPRPQPLVDWSTQPVFDPAHTEGAPS